MTSRGPRRSLRLGAVALALALGLTACGGGDGKKKKAEDEPTKKDGVELTPSGTELELGESAKLEWQASQKKEGVVELAVTKILQGSARDEKLVQIRPPLADYNLYYVFVTLENVGTTDLGGVKLVNLPLRLEDSSEVLKPPADINDMVFEPCPLPVLPKAWGPGKTAEVCLVYPTQGGIEQLVLQPADEDEITWPGEVTVPEKKTKKTSRKPKQEPSAEE